MGRPCARKGPTGDPSAPRPYAAEWERVARAATPKCRGLARRRLDLRPRTVGLLKRVQRLGLARERRTRAEPDLAPLPHPLLLRRAGADERHEPERWRDRLVDRAVGARRVLDTPWRLLRLRARDDLLRLLALRYARRDRGTERPRRRL